MVKRKIIRSDLFEVDLLKVIRDGQKEMIRRR